MRLLTPVCLTLWIIGGGYGIAHAIWLGDHAAAQRAVLALAITATVALMLRRRGTEWRAGYHQGRADERNHQH